MADPSFFDDYDFRSPRVARDGGGLDVDGEAALVMGDDGHLIREVALHSLDKAHYVRYFADIVTTGMRTAYGGPLAWIELFAGPGRLFVKDLQRYRKGSPVEAAEGLRVPFDHYVFSDLDPRCVGALQSRIGHLSNVHIFEGDANSAALHDTILPCVPRNALTILYVDPAGLHVDFSTLRFFADRYAHLDLLINLPVPGLDRALSAKQTAKAAKVLNHDEPIQLLSAPNARTSVREWFERQLGALGYDHFCVKQIFHAQKRSAQYDLMLASRNKRAKEFFQEAVRHPPGGQKTMEMF